MQKANNRPRSAKGGNGCTDHAPRGHDAHQTPNRLIAIKRTWEDHHVVQGTEDHARAERDGRISGLFCDDAH